MEISKVMTTELVTAGPSSTLRDIAESMRKCDIGCMPIVEGQRLVGIVTDRDIVVRAVATGLDLSVHTASEVMSTQLITATQQMSAEAAARQMAAAKIRRLPVVDNGRLVGVVSLGDLAVETHDTATCGHTLEEVSSPRGPKCAAA